MKNVIFSEASRGKVCKLSFMLLRYILIHKTLFQRKAGILQILPQKTQLNRSLARKGISVNDTKSQNRKQPEKNLIRVCVSNT